MVKSRREIRDEIIQRWKADPTMREEMLQEHRADIVLALFEAYCLAAREHRPDSLLFLVAAALAWLDQENSDVVASLAEYAFEGASELTIEKVFDRIWDDIQIIRGLSEEDGQEGETA